ncbi:hypothetical protein BDV11DRAFT_193850 [Aspergillus similis]
MMDRAVTGSFQLPWSWLSLWLRLSTTASRNEAVDQDQITVVLNSASSLVCQLLPSGILQRNYPLLFSNRRPAPLDISCASTIEHTSHDTSRSRVSSSILPANLCREPNIYVCGVTPSNASKNTKGWLEESC